MNNILISKWKNKLEKLGYNPDAFFDPSYDEHTHDPYLMRDMEKAVVKIFEVVEAKEKIFIFTDYDCDGIPGAVAFTDFLKKIGHLNYEVYIPHREDEGYGLSNLGIDEALAKGAALLVTIDLGITAVEEVNYAMSQGLPVIVTDHHLPKDVLPHAYAILNPKIDDYPEKMLCGSGVVFKLIQGFLVKYGEYYKVGKGYEKWLLDMVGLATIADMVPLLGENRIFAKYGLLVMRKARRPGLRELLKKFGIMYRKITEDDIYFSVTPAINAASRMDDPRLAFKLLSSDTDIEAAALADELYKLNTSRKTLVANIMKDVYKRLDSRDLGKVVVVGDPDWRGGVLGLVAGKIADKYKKPAFVWGGNGDYFKGSVRSFGGVNIVELMQRASDSFESFGGHKEAGGFVVSREKVHFLEEALIKHFEEGTVEEDDEEVIDIGMDHVNGSLFKTLEDLAPFGVGNEKPLFKLSGIRIEGASMFGKSKEHLSLLISNDEKELKAIAFFADDELIKTYTKDFMSINSIEGYLEKNYFRGEEEVRLRISD